MTLRRGTTSTSCKCSLMATDLDKVMSQHSAWQWMMGVRCHAVQPHHSNIRMLPINEKNHGSVDLQLVIRQTSAPLCMYLHGLYTAGELKLLRFEWCTPFKDAIITVYTVNPYVHPVAHTKNDATRPWRLTVFQKQIQLQHKWSRYVGKGPLNVLQ